MFKRTVVMIVAIFMFMNAQAEYIDLKGTDIINQGICRHSDGKQYLCISVMHEKKMYNVLLDKDGEVAIYLVENNVSKFIWARSSI